MLQLKCSSCLFRLTIPGDSHISCAKPDPAMTGDPHGMANGWFMYPWNFDPIWGTKECDNYADRRTDTPVAKSEQKEDQ